MPTIRVPSGVLIAGILFWTAAAAWGAASVSHLTVSTDDERLLLHLGLEGAFPPRVKERVLEGKPVSIVFTIRLNRVRDLWLDERIADRVVEHILRFDRVKNEFTVRRSWRGFEAETTPSFEEARQWMSWIEGYPLAGLDRLTRGSSYALLAQAGIVRRGLPWGLHHVLFFLSFWEEETDWYVLHFRY
ncbi:MAG: DUF4390 domain-containing protein [Desulfobacterales bacterium]